jgi:hypothetical protein
LEDGKDLSCKFNFSIPIYTNNPASNL